MTVKRLADGTVRRQPTKNDMFTAEYELRKFDIAAERRGIDGKYLVRFGTDNVEVMTARDVYMLARGIRLGGRV